MIQKKAHFTQCLDAKWMVADLPSVLMQNRWLLAVLVQFV